MHRITQFGKRITHGYGNISPKNCYLDGQSTNCHLNFLITNYLDEIELFVLALDDDLEINRLERELIKALKPEWNILL